MVTLEMGARLLLGGIFLVFGVDYVFHFMPELPFTAEGGRYLEALLATGYMFPLIKGVEVTAALLILGGRYAPLGIAVALPVIVNIMLYHLLLDPNGATIAALLVSAEAFLLWRFRSVYRPLFIPQVSAAGDRVSRPLGEPAASGS
jgi:hypothetical protein